MGLFCSPFEKVYIDFVYIDDKRMGLASGLACVRGPRAWNVRDRFPELLNLTYD
jgi:hypothetical protein